jgi:hypothetical protein
MLVYFMDIRFISRPFGMFSPFWYVWTDKNLATLICRQTRKKENLESAIKSENMTTCLLADRATRLGKFSPIGPLFTLDRFLKKLQI